MTRLIDADAIEYSPYDEVYNNGVMIAYKDKIDKMPTIEAKLIFHSTRKDENGVAWVIGKNGWEKKEK